MRSAIFAVIAAPNVRVLQEQGVRAWAARAPPSGCSLVAKPTVTYDMEAGEFRSDLSYRLKGFRSYATLRARMRTFQRGENLVEALRSPDGKRIDLIPGKQCPASLTYPWR